MLLISKAIQFLTYIEFKGAEIDSYLGSAYVLTQTSLLPPLILDIAIGIRFLSWIIFVCDLRGRVAIAN